jgi:hypothetical protein
LQGWKTDVELVARQKLLLEPMVYNSVAVVQAPPSGHARQPTLFADDGDVTSLPLKNPALQMQSALEVAAGCVVLLSRDRTSGSLQAWQNADFSFS